MRHVLQWDQPTTPVKDAIKEPPASCRAHEIMRMMWCVGSQSSVSQMNFLLHGSVWLQSMDSNPSASCRAYEIMRMNECVVEHKTVQHSNGFYYIIRCSSILFVPLCCSLFYSYNPDCFEAMGPLIRRSSSCFAFEKSIMSCVPLHRNVQDIRIQRHADELVCTIWWAMSHTFEHSGYPQVSKSLHAPCSAMRSTDDTRARCNQKTTCIMSCAWDHAHDVMRREPEQSFTDESLASWFCLVAKHGFKSVCIMSCVWDHAHERMRSRT